VTGGAKSHLRLLDRPAPFERSRSDAAACHPAQGLRRRPVLYIGAEPENRIPFTRIARRWPTIKLLLSPGAEEGLQIAIDRRLRMVVLDARLPGADAVVLTRSLRARAASPSAPIVILAGDNTSIERARFIWAGANAYVFRPFAATEVDRTVGMLLEASAIG